MLHLSILKASLHYVGNTEGWCLWRRCLSLIHLC